MPTEAPIVSQIAWISAIPQIVILGFFIYLFFLLGVGFPFVFGPLTYLVLSYGLKKLLTNNHQKGINAIKKGNFKDAIPHFEKSVEHFDQNSWVDKYRFLTVLSSSRMTYREMSLCNIAFCYAQTGNGSKAIEYYELALKDYPNNILAKAALKFVDSVKLF